MPLSQPQRSPYRDRRINVMMQESASGGKGNDEATAESATRKLKTGKTSRPAMLGIGLATAGLCALGVFLVLFRHDTAGVVTSVPVQPVQTATQSTPAPVATRPAQEAAPVQAPATQTAPLAVTRVQFRLSRANRVQTVGPVNLRLMATNVRKGTCSVLVGAANTRPNQYTIQINRPFKVTLQSGSSANVLVTGISKASISGYINGI